jgi:hypothetical protein
VIAAVNVVFPWSTCPIVPTFTCGFVRSNLALAIASLVLGVSGFVLAMGYWLLAIQPTRVANS